LSKREDGLERKTDVLSKKEKYIEKLEESLAAKRQELSDQQAELEKLVDQEMQTLRKIANLSQEEATSILLKRLEQQMDRECADLISRRLEDARENAEKQARRIVSIAIQRYAADQTVENVVSSVALPSDEMKGRIIGREGRNIRAFEKENRRGRDRGRYPGGCGRQRVRRRAARGGAQGHGAACHRRAHSSGPY